MKSPVLSRQALEAAVASMPTDCLTERRHAALEALSSAGMPGTREEDWKYTDVSALVDITNRWLEAGAGYPPAADIPAPNINAHWIRIENGRVDPRSLEGLPGGVAVRRVGESGTVSDTQGRLGDLNLALLLDGLQISVTSSARLTRPIGLFISDASAGGANTSQVRADIDVAPDAGAGFIEYHASAGEGDHYANSVIRLHIGAGGHADYVRIQDRCRHHNQTGYLAVTARKDATFRHASFDFGGRLIRNDLLVDIAEPGVTVDFGGLYLVGEAQHTDNHTRVDHRVGPAVSRQQYRGILAGNARAVWNGKAVVHSGADGTDAEQSNHNLLLTEGAEIDAKPELEIYADDVKCSHGTTVGQLDEAALFYLRSRGLSRMDARQVLTRAFAQAIVRQIPIETLHEFVADRIARRLDDLVQDTGQ